MTMRVATALLNKDNEMKSLIFSMYDNKEISYEAAMKIIWSLMTKMVYTDDKRYDGIPLTEDPWERRCGHCLTPMKSGDPKYSMHYVVALLYPGDMYNYNLPTGSKEFKAYRAFFRTHTILGDVCESCFLKLLTEYYGKDKAEWIKKELESKMEYDTWHVKVHKGGNEPWMNDCM